MTSDSKKDKAMGAIMGALIGDALGLGCHWYYDLALLKQEYGNWISDYTTSKKDRKDKFAKIAAFRYDAGLKAGDVSQTGQVTILLLESLGECGSYNQGDFTSKLDSLFATLDGKPLSGRFTDWAMRDVWQQRRSGLDWSEAGSRADTSEAAMRSVVLAAGLFTHPERLAKVAFQNIGLTHREPYITGQSLAFALTVAALINGSTVEGLGQYMNDLAGNRTVRDLVPSYDCLMQVINGAVAVNTSLTIEPAALICSLYGLACTLGFMLPAAYYLIHRLPDDFEMAVLSAINGGGNNMARAALTGALSGALVGLEGIPGRFIRGLKDHERLLNLAEKVAGNGA